YARAVPGGPVAPAAPGGPLDPAGPVGPTAPALPLKPRGPRRLSAFFERLSDRFAVFSAFFATCIGDGAPIAGNDTASEMTSASTTTTFSGLMPVVVTGPHSRRTRLA